MPHAQSQQSSQHLSYYLFTRKLPPSRHRSQSNTLATPQPGMNSPNSTEYRYVPPPPARPIRSCCWVRRGRARSGGDSPAATTSGRRRGSGGGRRKLRGEESGRGGFLGRWERDKGEAGVRIVEDVVGEMPFGACCSLRSTWYIPPSANQSITLKKTHISEGKS